MISQKRWMYLIAAAVMLIAVEVASYVTARILLPTGLIIGPPDLTGYAEYLENRDPVLGWPGPAAFGNGEYDISGSRIVPEFPDPEMNSCVAIFGDSFTWGAEVSADDAYGNVLSQLMGCRVANYGVGGYGTDQAVIRYMHVIQDDAPVVVLGHFSENIIRNLNQLRDFIAPGRFGFKPRFVLESDELEIVPLPTLSANEYRSVASRAEELLPHEYFSPRTRGAPGVMRFPYSLAVLDSVFHYRVTAALRGIRPTYSNFYLNEHPSNALEITTRLILAAKDVATERNQEFLVLLIPDVHDLRAVRSGKDAAYAPLRQKLKSAGVKIIDAAEYLDAKNEHEDFCGLFVKCRSSHFNSDGYRLLAEAVSLEISLF